MENAQVLDNGRKIVINLKRKRATQCSRNFTGAARMVRARRSASASLSNKLSERLGSDECKGINGSCFKNPVLQNYSNFMKSRLPQRLMFYQSGEWVDFPRYIVDLISDDFQAKKLGIEIEFEGQCSLLDFLHMVQVDLRTGSQKPIAWIDEVGKCFFPEVYSDIDESHDSFQCEAQNPQELSHFQPNGTGDIKLQLEIEITGPEDSQPEECSEEPYAHVQQLKVEGKSGNNNDILNSNGSRNDKSYENIEEVIGENQQLGAISNAENSSFESSDGILSCESLKKLFLSGMGSVIDDKDIIKTCHISSNSVQIRFELFQKQVEIMKKYRGFANIHYAWFASSKEAASRIAMHGFDFNDITESKPTYGTGIHLYPTSCVDTGARYCDVDENGIRHMVFCQVIMGNMEIVHPGSKQFHPSSANFDSGVDDIQNPRRLIVWNMHMNTHIFPQYIVSFRVSPTAKGFLVGKQRKFHVSGVTNSARCQDQIQKDPSPVGFVGNSSSFPVPGNRSQEKAPTTDPSTPRVPKSAWLPFPILFDAISNKVPPGKMKLVHNQYDRFTRKMITREEFVKKLRCLVGDSVLKTTIENIPTKVPVPNPGRNFQVGNQEEDEVSSSSKTGNPPT